MQTLRRLLSFAVVFALVGGAVVFAVGNQTPVPVYYLFGRAEEQPLWLVTGIALLLGATAAWLASLWLISRAKLAERRYRKQTERLEAEIHELRNLPLARGGEATVETQTVATPAGSAPPPSTTSTSPPSGEG